MKRKLKLYTKQLKSGKITLLEIQRSIAGWTGYVKHADTFNLMKSFSDSNEKVPLLFVLSTGSDPKNDFQQLADSLGRKVLYRGLYPGE